MVRDLEYCIGRGVGGGICSEQAQMWIKRRPYCELCGGRELLYMREQVKVLPATREGRPLPPPEQRREIRCRACGGTGRIADLRGVGAEASGGRGAGAVVATAVIVPKAVTCRACHDED